MTAPRTVLAFLVLALLPTTATAQTTHVIEDGQAQIVPEFADTATWIRHELWVETEFDTDGDGRPDRVHVDVTRPGQTDAEGLKVPVIYETSPYYSGVAGLDFDHFWNLRQEVGGDPITRDPFPATIAHRATQPIISMSHVRTWVPRGFAVIHSQSPGTGQSQGCPTVGGANESLAPKAVIDWLNGRARGFTSLDGDEEVEAYWATGKVGMTGTSYNGTLPLAAATTGVEGLEAIIPIAPNTSYYHYYRSNGLVRSPGGYPGEDIDVLFDFIFSSFPHVRDYCIANVRAEMDEHLDRTTGDYNDFWAERDYLNHIDGVRAATLMAHGFNDWNVMPEHSYRIAMALERAGRAGADLLPPGRPRRASPAGAHESLVHPLRDGCRERRRERSRGVDRARGRRNGEPDLVRQLSAPRGRGCETASRRRRQMDRNPVPGGRPDRGTGGVVDNFAFSGNQLAAVEWSNHRLLYSTPELREDVHLSGEATVRVRVSADAAAANLTVWLVSLPWADEPEHINDNIITKGWADPSNAGAENIASPRSGTPLTPGEFVELEFALQPDDQVIPAGARIGLMIFSSDQLYTVHPEPGTMLTVDLAGTSVSLPVVGGVAALTRAIRPAS